MNTRAAAGCLVLGMAGVLIGCAGGGSERTASDGPVNTGLEQYAGTNESASASQPSGSTDSMSREDIADWLKQDAELLPSLAEGRTPDSPRLAEASPVRSNPTPTMTVDLGGGDESSNIDASLANASQKPESQESQRESSVTSIEESPAVARQRLVGELATLLRRAVRESGAPLREYAALAALELLEPGVTPDPTSIPTLTPREVELLGAWRDLFLRTDEELSSASGDIGALSTVVSELSTRMQEWETLRIATAQLCSRVEGFGVYTPLPGPKLLAGRRNAAIVYVELEHFTHRASSGPNGEPGYLVELGQELSLYHDADGLLAWRQSEQRIEDFSRNRRRDFFMVQRIDLPETLSVGAYRLKITMRDRATGAVAEQVVPIEFVADAALVRAQ